MEKYTANLDEVLRALMKFARDIKARVELLESKVDDYLLKDFTVNTKRKIETLENEVEYLMRSRDD